MTNRKSSRVAFIYVVATAIVATGIILFSLMMGWSWSQSLILLGGALVVLWAIIFSFLEVRRIGDRRAKIGGTDHVIDPDAPRKVVVQPPTNAPTTHHELQPGSPGLDQGQLTSNLPDGMELVSKSDHRDQ